jgi:hypothetical protein
MPLMRWIFLALLLLAPPAHAATVTAIRTSQVTQSLCIQVKTANTGGTGQPTLANLEANLAYLNPLGIGTGISCVRDDWVNGNVSSLYALGALGYKLDLYMGYNSAASNSGYSAISTLLNYKTSGYLAAVEGLAQVDAASSGCVVLSTCSYTSAYTGITYTGSPTSPNWQVAVAAQQDLWNALGGCVPVYLWSIVTPTNGASNSPAVTAATALGTSIGAITNNGNVQFFPSDGNSSIAVAQTVLNEATGYSPIGTQGITGFGITELGYVNGNDSGNYVYGAAYPNAAYTLDSIFINQAGSGSALTHAASLTSFYELVPDATGDDWGWFGPYSTPTAARSVATDVQNLMAIIGDAGFSATTFLPGALTYTISGLPSNGGSLLMQQSNFSFDLAVWVNASIYTGGVTSTAPTNGVTVTVGKDHGISGYFAQSYAVANIQLQSWGQAGR